MEQARAMINLRDGIIDIQGPVDFVRRYLDSYTMKGMKVSSEVQRSSGKVEAPAEKKAPLARRRKKRGTCLKVIQGYIGDGYFDLPRSLGEVKRHAADDGYSFSDGICGRSLKKLVSRGELVMTGATRGRRYQRQGA